MSQSPFRRGGGRYVDLSFEANGTAMHVLTAELDSEGDPVRREVSAAEDIRAAMPEAVVSIFPKRPQE
jgi:hypothetical protein